MPNEADCFFSVVIPTYNRAELLRQTLPIFHLYHFNFSTNKINVRWKNR